MSMTQKPKPGAPKAPAAPPPPERMTKRAITRRDREHARQRLVIIIASTVIGIALVAVVIGVLFDRVWTPSRPIATANGVTLSRNDYWTARRHDLTRQIAQSLQFKRLLGAQAGQFGQQIQNQLVTAERQVPAITSSADDPTTIENWVERQVITQGAARMGITLADGAIAQRAVTDLGTVFQPTGELTITGTLVPPPTLAPTATTGPSPTPGGPTATAAPTATEGPSATPQPTLLPDAAATQQDKVFTALRDAYVEDLAAVDQTLKPSLSVQDFKDSLTEQYQRDLLSDKIKEQLVAEANFPLSTEPSAIQTSHILLKATLPLSPTKEQSDAAFAARKSEIDAVSARIKGGEAFDAVAKAVSEDVTTKDKGGQIESFDKTGKTTGGQQVDPAYLQAALALKEGEVSQPIQTAFGWEIVKVTKITVPTKDEQLRDARTKAFDTWLKNERGQAAVTFIPDRTVTPTPAPTVAAPTVPAPTYALGGEPTAVPTEAPAGPAAPTPAAAAAPAAPTAAAPTPTP